MSSKKPWFKKIEKAFKESLVAIIGGAFVGAAVMEIIRRKSQKKA